ncbi:MAG TPA: SagB family peptide dehydrogenase [Pirellulales bacterium]|nr:SagB family peptide dehydrogenase [Pirellulales bacterium]
MSASLCLSWQDSVSLSASDGRAVVAGPCSRIAWRAVAPEIVAAMRRLDPPGEDEQRLADSVLAGGSVHSLARWFHHVDELRRRGLIRRSLHADGTLIATVVPLGRDLGPSTQAGSVPARLPAAGNSSRSLDANRRSDQSYVLSRFAYMRREGRELLLESPLAHARVVLHDPRAMAMIAALAVPMTTMRLAEQVAEMSPSAVNSLVALLAEMRMVDQVGAETAPIEHDHSALDSWEFHDLLFHARSRRGRTDGQFGATYRLARRPPPPALKAADECPGHDLHRPDLERLERDDPPLAFVQQRRQSVRRYASKPITAEQLGEFLYRVARVTDQWRSEIATSSGTVTMEFASRPYPAGGGLYELEFHLAVRACRGLAIGLYHYDPEHHRLRRLGPDTRDLDLLLDEAAASAGIVADTLQVLVILTARFQRLAWKYESIAYSLVLKHVGVVYQTMYLAATAMGLAPCALGCGDSDRFARAAGTDYYVETSVGEFLLGSRE